MGFIPGVEPDRFAQRWEAGPRPARLVLTPLRATRALGALQDGDVDMCFLRLPVPTEPTGGTVPAATEDALHLVPLWEEQEVIVVGAENTLSLLEEIGPEDLTGEPEIPAGGPDDAAERVDIVATGIGWTRMPLSLARAHHRKDVVHRPATDGRPTRIALAWPRAQDDEVRQEFVGTVRGRTARSSR